MTCRLVLPAVIRHSQFYEHVKLLEGAPSPDCTHCVPQARCLDAMAPAGQRELAQVQVQSVLTSHSQQQTHAVVWQSGEGLVFFVSSN